MLKKVYIEITNNCNLNCSFCTLKKKKNKVVSVDDFNIILDKLKGHTNYSYQDYLTPPRLHNMSGRNFRLIYIIQHNLCGRNNYFSFSSTHSLPITMFSSDLLYIQPSSEI